MDRDLSGCINRTFTMNTLHWIAIALFASALFSGLLLFIEATFLLFTTGVLVLAIATYVKDNEQERKNNRL